ncbi:hypothetical protein LOK49_LG03G03368 [Camellia lanceoleosa]|uniref:Uncharacterized protein n=1 Tax=Camellia lanceoleosa TaxID=1840588 RepID=A0ACC0IGA9_9ERIC|nr:hypothetical protein LOK49_LG03G03368 [Camellia lanceoleosa]
MYKKMLGFWASHRNSEIRAVLASEWENDTELDIQNNRITRGTGHLTLFITDVYLIDLTMFGDELLCQIQVVEDGDYDLAQVLTGNEKTLVHMHLHIVIGDAIVALNTTFQLGLT